MTISSDLAPLRCDCDDADGWPALLPKPVGALPSRRPTLEKSHLLDSTEASASSGSGGYWLGKQCGSSVGRTILIIGIKG